MTDREIVALFFARDESAIAQIDSAYGNYCRAIADSILQNDEDTEECVSDAYLRAWNAIPPASPLLLRTYLGKITRRLAFDRYQKRHADKRGGGQIPLILDELSECLPSRGNPDETDNTLLTQDCLDRFLRSLPDEQRWMFVRRYWYAARVKDIAKALHKSENDVSVTLSRLRSKLKDELEKEGIDI